jgi:hypothetical protein
MAEMIECPTSAGCETTEGRPEEEGGGAGQMEAYLSSGMSSDVLSPRLLVGLLGGDDGSVDICVHTIRVEGKRKVSDHSIALAPVRDRPRRGRLTDP